MIFIKAFCAIVVSVGLCFAQGSSSNSITVTDADGNVYTTVKIGNQLWTAENLKTTKYNDGTPIPLLAEKEEWAKGCDTPAYCWYKNDYSSKDKYGALYNWYAVNTGKIAPKGWHVPTDEEWLKLVEYLISNGYNWDGTKENNKIAKTLAAKSDWESYDDDGAIGKDLPKNNRSGFSALPGGWRYRDGDFFNIGKCVDWWSATENNAKSAYSYSLIFSNDFLDRDYYRHKGCGLLYQVG